MASKIKRFPPKQNSNVIAMQKLAGINPDCFGQLVSGILETVPQGLIVADKQGKVIMLNPKAEALLGCAADEVVGQLYLWDFWQDKQTTIDLQTSILEGMAFPTGLSFPKTRLGVKFSPFFALDSTFLGVMATLLEEQPKHMARPASVGQIISAIAHEINNPLQTIRTSLELSQDPKKNPDRRQTYLKAADHEISRIVQIINQMRQFYRPTPGEKQVTNINKTIQTAVQLLATSLAETKLHPVLELDSSLPAVTLLSYQLEQVFLYLILQAMEVLLPGSHLYISTTKLEAGYLVINFTDSHTYHQSPIYHSSDKEPIFDPFHSGNSGGLGLGLSISQEIIKELGGYLQKSDGFSISVFLPY